MRVHVLCSIAAMALTATAHAGILATFTDDALSAGDPTQMGRLSRDGIISDWSGPKAFPGVINPTISYHYKTYVIPITNAPYVQITVDDPPGAIFASAYLNSYNPADLSMNYLGDAGISGNFFGVDPLFFQVVTPENADLVLVINDPSATGAGLGAPYSLLIEGFADANFDEAPTPEPGTLLVSAGGFACLVFAWRRRRRA